MKWSKAILSWMNDRGQWVKYWVSDRTGWWAGRAGPVACLGMPQDGLARGAARRAWPAIFRLALIVLMVMQMGAATRGDAAALVRIDLPGEAALRPLADQGLLVYTQIGAAGGGIILVAQAGAEQQVALAQSGYAVQVLDSDVRGEAYYLLYGMADDLDRAAETVDLLVVEGRQAVGSVGSEGLARLDQLGIRWLPLAARPLVAPATRQTTRMEGATVYSPLVQRMIDQVQTATLSQYVSELSGEQPVTINGEPYQLYTRYTPASEPIKKATRFAFERFQGLGLPVAFDDYILTPYSVTRRNVLAQQYGLTQPERIFLLTAHLDSIAGGNPNLYAPGADDNASGSAAVLLIADILRGYRFDCSLRYALFTGEEQGLYGSIAYAKEVWQNGENVQAVLNMDMLGYNTPGSTPFIELHTRPSNASDLAIAGLYADVISTYGLNLSPQILQDRLSASDHAPFWDRGYPAILAIEDWQDHTPNYHTPQDRLSTLDLAYYTAFVKASLATLVHMGCLLDGELSGTVSDATSGSPLAGANVEVWQNGQKTLSTSTQASGAYQSLLINGNYEVKFSAADHRGETVSNVAIIAGQITDLDRGLQPCNTVKDPAFNLSPNPAAPGETVTFSAQVSGGETLVSYSWDFGDGSLGAGDVVTHTYTMPGVFSVGMTADNLCSYPVSAANRSILVGNSFQFFPLAGR